MATWDGTFERNLTKLVEKDLDRRAVNVRDAAQSLEARRVRRRTGTYNKSFRIIRGRGQRTIRNTAPHGLALELGTGIYGPKGRPITPKKGQFLRFTVDGRVVFARQVKGIRPRRVLTDALQKAKP